MASILLNADYAKSALRVYAPLLTVEHVKAAAGLSFRPAVPPSRRTCREIQRAMAHGSNSRRPRAGTGQWCSATRRKPGTPPPWSNPDRTSDGEGKGVAVRVDLGG